MNQRAQELHLGLAERGAPLGVALVVLGAVVLHFGKKRLEERL
jgi:hypothetical protein